MGGPSKSANPPRRASSSLSKVSTPTSAARTSKASKPIRMVRLKLPSSTLSRFPHEPTPRKAASTKAAHSTPKPVAPVETATPVETKAEIKLEPKAKATSTPVSAAPFIKPSPAEDISQKGLPGPKTGAKRELGAGVEGGAKSRARPGPKKKAKTGDGIDNNNGDSTGKGTPGVAPAPTHKLGPKANQGAINAGLRALDRSGKPCKRWKKSGFSLKTFTGVTWQITTWRAPKTKKIESEPGVEQVSLPASNSQSKENNNSSNVGSEKSGSGEADLPVAASSPIPAIAAPA